MDRTKALQWGGTVFAVSTTFAQVVTINSDWVINNTIILTCGYLQSIVVGVNIAFWGFVSYILNKKHKTRISLPQVKIFQNLILRHPPQYKQVKTTGELEIVSNQLQQDYKALNFGINNLHDWWNKNNNSIIIRKRGSVIEASMGIWPVQKHAFKKLLEGNKPGQPNIIDIITPDEEAAAPFWYISGILTHSKEDFVHELLGQTFKAFIQRVSQNVTEINIVFISVTDAESLILKQLGFAKIGEIGKYITWCYSSDSLEHLKNVTDVLLSYSTTHS